jgi:hypothetical protein
MQAHRPGMAEFINCPLPPRDRNNNMAEQK